MTLRRQKIMSLSPWPFRSQCSGGRNLRTGRGYRSQGKNGTPLRLPEWQLCQSFQWHPGGGDRMPPSWTRDPQDEMTFGMESEGRGSPYTWAQSGTKTTPGQWILEMAAVEGSSAPEESLIPLNTVLGPLLITPCSSHSNPGRYSCPPLEKRGF